MVRYNLLLLIAVHMIYDDPDEYDSYIILSFNTVTLVLSIGETIEEVQGETGFLTASTTIAVQQLGTDSLLQVHPTGIRRVFANREVQEWRAPRHKTIIAAATNHNQVVAALSGGELVYFEIDNNELNEYQGKKELGAGVITMSLGEVAEGRLRTDFLAVGCDDSTVRIISLDLNPDKTLETLSLQVRSSAKVLKLLIVYSAGSYGSTDDNPHL
jgi:splicing factor 3B subunit 3